MNPSSLTLASLRELYSGRRAADDTPSLISAGRDIRVEGIGGTQLWLASAAHISAGRDIVNFALKGQNVRPDDVTSVSAGRDVRYESGNRTSLIEVGGPGRLDILAGVDVDFGFSAGASTVVGSSTPSCRNWAERTSPSSQVSRPAWTSSDSSMGSSRRRQGNQKRLIAYVESETGKSGLLVR